MSQDPVTTTFKDMLEAQKDARSEAHRISPSLRNNEATSKNRSLISREEVLALTSFSYSQIVRLERRGEFPRSYKIGDRRVAYLRREVEDWIDDKLKASASV